MQDQHHIFSASHRHVTSSESIIFQSTSR